ncbi:hypothetical protein D3C86_1618970 [compost metagenome]
MRAFDDEHEAQTYNRLFEILQEQPTVGPSFSFSKKVLNTLKKEIERTNQRRFYIFLVLIFIGCITGVLIILNLMDKYYKTDFVPVAKAHMATFIFCFALLFLIQYLDQKLIKKKYQHELPD